ncbi:MAG: filamentous hemagglutinin N-terminal domain-containing protein, partial [Lentisphaeria bacterium]
MKTRKEARLYRSSWTQKLLSLFLVAVLTLSPGGLLARNLPTGGKIAKGQATINVNGQTMTIDQLTSKAIINWDSFDIGKGYGVDVNQISKNAAMLSRVIGGNPSEILGRLSATGHFYLVNPSGILFGQGAQVDVNRLIASTLDITDDNFMADKLLFEGSSDAAVINQGLVNAQAVALIGKEVSNTGEINAKQVAMLGTKSVELGNVHGGKLSIDFSGFTEDSSVSNAGVINASELGEVILYAENGKTDNAQGTITTGELEISGKIVNLQELGNISFSHLLIDPTGVLYFGGDELSGGGVGEATGSPWPAADSYITEATIQTLLGTGALTLDWDQIIINGDVDDSRGTGGKRLTLKALGSGSNGGILTDGAHTLTMGGHDLYMVIEPTGTDGGDINLTDLTIITNSRLDIEARQKQILVNNEYNQLSGVVALKGRDVSLNNTGSTHFGVSTIRNGGSLQVTSGGKITQQGAITVQGSGTANFNAGTNDVILDHNGNAFSGTVSFIAKDVEIVNKHANGIQFAESEIGGTLTATATAGGISQTDAISVGGASLLS